MIVKPNNLSVLKVMHVELIELPLHLIHLEWYSTFWRILERPMPTCKNLSLKFDIMYDFATVVHPISVFLHCLLTLLDILKHGFNLVDGVVTTLYLELLDHEEFCFI